MTRIAAAALLAAAIPLLSIAQPHVGQPGKDVMWVPTPEAVVERMLKMTRVAPTDFVVDLGSGDGRIVIAAAKAFGAQASGIEFNPELVALAKLNARAAGVEHKVRFVQGDLFKLDWSAATVVTMYLLPELNMRLRPRLLEMKPGTRLASHQFGMNDWEPDERVELDGRVAYAWVVPARVAGQWSLSYSVGPATTTHALALRQAYQKISGTVSQGGYTATLEDARLRGTEIVLAFVDRTGVKRRLVGRVGESQMEGRLDSDRAIEVRWIASRAKNPR